MATTYMTAADAARDVLILGLKDNLDQSTLGELWRHYLGLRCIAEGITPPPKDFSVSDEGIEYPYSSYPAAAESVTLDFGQGQDVISFG